MFDKRFVVVLLTFLLVACSSSTTPSSSLPTPEYACQAAVNWRGIVPGQSTKRDVVRILGKPAYKGSERYADGRVSFYAYEIEGGAIADLAEDRIFFGKDGVVAWIEVMVADRDGQTHTIQEIVDQLGATLDQVYVNNNLRHPDQFEVQAGPDEIYVWTECGLAVSAASMYFDSQDTSTSLIVRQPVHPDDSLQPLPDIESTVLFKVFFPPTSFDGFNEFYREKVPFHYFWTKYLRRSN